jgi:surfactin synthase thioesterase subunit
MGGCPPEVLRDRELLEFFEPVLRADFQAVETWESRGGGPLAVPVTVMIGRDDEVSEANARLWSRETTMPVRMHLFDGNHFFLLAEWARIASIVEAQLTRVDHAESQRAS